MTNDEQAWNAYLIRCGDGSIYAGVAKDVEKRFRDHGGSRGSRYVRAHGGPSEIVWRAGGMSQGDALRAERWLKSLTRPRKDALVLGKIALPAA